MDWLRKWDTLPQEVRQLILHNGADMERFYTLSTEERQEVLNRIRMANTPDELDAITGDLMDRVHALGEGQS